MKINKSIILVLCFIFVLGMCIQITRLNTFMKIKDNEYLKNSLNIKGETLDSKLISHTNNEEFLVVYEDALNDLKENVITTLKYMKKDYKILNVVELKKIEDKYKNIILIVSDLNKVKELNILTSFIFTGGNVFFTNNLELSTLTQEIYSILGIIEFGEYKVTNGVRIIDNILIGAKDMEFKDDSLKNFSIQVQLSNKCKNHIVSSENLDLLWSNRYGKGKVFYFNGTMLNSKSNRGVIAAVISNMEKDCIYPIMNTKINFIDDFPSPLPYGSNETIFKEYRRSTAQFYRENWWPDLLSIGARNNIKYTGVLIGTYNDNIDNIKEDSIEIKNSDFEYFTKEIFSTGGEIGIHGYNHQPLTRDNLDKSLGYNSWKKQKDMVEGIENLIGYTKSRLKNYALNTYVPPSNIISEEGIEALKESNEDFKILSSLYNVGKSDTNEYEQELNIREDGIMELPRISAGYLNKDIIIWNNINTINSLGYFSHFIHPDDILDEERNSGFSWGNLSKEFNDFQNTINSKYLWLNPTTATEAANELIKYTNTKVYYEKNDNYINILCDNYIGPIEFIIKTEKKIRKTEDCDLTKIDEGVYLIKVKKAESKIIF